MLLAFYLFVINRLYVLRSQIERLETLKSEWKTATPTEEVWLKAKALLEGVPHSPSQKALTQLKKRIRTEIRSKRKELKKLEEKIKRFKPKSILKKTLSYEEGEYSEVNQIASFSKAVVKFTDTDFSSPFSFYLKGQALFQYGLHVRNQLTNAKARDKLEGELQDFLLILIQECYPHLQPADKLQFANWVANTPHDLTVSCETDKEIRALFKAFRSVSSEHSDFFQESYYLQRLIDDQSLSDGQILDAIKRFKERLIQRLSQSSHAELRRGYFSLLLFAEEMREDITKTKERIIFAGSILNFVPKELTQELFDWQFG